MKRLKYEENLQISEETMFTLIISTVWTMEWFVSLHCI